MVVVDVDGERSFKVWKVVAGRPRLAFANLRYPTFETAATAEIEVWAGRERLREPAASGASLNQVVTPSRFNGAR